MRKKVLVLAGDVSSTPALVHALAREHEVCRVIIEDREPRVRFLRRRVARLGVLTVLGQVLFYAIVPLLARMSRARLAAIQAAYSLDETPLDPSLVTRVTSVNDPITLSHIHTYAPDVIVLHGTRIVSAKILEAAGVPCVNIHAGITPMYRGVHGGYWALAEGHPEWYGVTVHLVDPGIDTGEVLAQRFCTAVAGDTFVTYPLVQLGEGVAALLAVLKESTFTTHTPPAPFSRVWYHPTLWGYLYTRVVRGVR